MLRRVLDSFVHTRDLFVLETGDAMSQEESTSRQAQRQPNDQSSQPETREVGWLLGGGTASLFVSLLLVAPSVAFGQSDDIDARCAAKWEDSARMQRHCREQQTEAKRWVRQFEQSHDDSTRMTILKNCKDKWSDSHGHNWRMVKHCTEQQVEAANKVQDSNGEGSSSAIDTRCRQKWEDNFRMQEHCRDQQTDARDWIRNTFDADGSPTKGAVLSRCKSKWSDGPGYNWRMVKHCIERQN